MPIEPMDVIDSSDQAASKGSVLNTWVALAVALLATFTGICQVKDSNIGQAMQQAQADKLDHWNFYQARNIRQEIATAAEVQLRLALPNAHGSQQMAIDSALHRYELLVADQAAKKDTLRAQAEQDQATYDALNYRDDQFDLSDALIVLAISLLALTALTQKRWLFVVACVPIVLGVIMGLAGLLSWHVHPDTITRLLS